MEALFARIPIPQHHRAAKVASRARWYSWSPRSVDLVHSNLDRLGALPIPRCVAVRGCEPYDSTYSYRLSGLSSRLLDLALESAESLLLVRMGSRMRFFSRTLDDPFSSSILHKYFALIRAGLPWVQGDARAALHAPVQAESKDDGFPLDPDLFLTDRLWLLFDDVPDDTSGRSLFLPRASLEAAIRSNRMIPPATRRRLRALMNGRMGKDSFDECYDLLHADANPWKQSLARAMTREQWTIRLRRGEGYLLHDRRWLHGRTAVKGRVSSGRFRRLVYGDAAESAKRTTTAGR